MLTLDSGAPWEIEDFWADIVGEVFAGYREVLALLPTGSYKTTTIGGLALYHMQFREDARVPVGAASKDQAGLLFEQAAGFVRRSSSLSKRFRVYDGYRTIVCHRTAGKLKVYSASDDTGDGIIPTFPIIDELHRHRDDHLYSTWRDKLTKRNGQLMVISTAGDDESNPVEELRDAARKLPIVVTTGRHTVARSEGREFVMHEYALNAKDDPEDLEVVKLVNPASQVTIEELRMRRDSPSTKRWQWLRFTCNVRSKGEESEIQPETWDGLLEAGVTIGPRVPAYVGLDLGWKIDHCGITPLGWESPERRVCAGAITLAPPVSEDDIVSALIDLHKRLDVRGVVYDPNAGGQQMAQLLEKGTHPLQLEREAPPMTFIEHTQDNGPMALAAGLLDEAIRKGWLVHDGAAGCTSELCRCGGLRGHALNAVRRVLGAEKWKYDRPSDAKGSRRAKYPIDGLTGLLMANAIAALLADRERPSFERLA